MLQNIGKKVLITTSNWFIAPDGKDYRAVHGTLKGVHEAGKSLGFIPNRAHANWFIEVGAMIIMGCQVMYVVECENVEKGNTTDYKYSEQTSSIVSYEKPTSIYITD